MKTSVKPLCVFERLFYFLICVTLLLACSSNEASPGSEPDPVIVEEEEKEDVFSVVKLNLRVHIMTDIVMTHTTGVVMEPWVTPTEVESIIIPEVNEIWDQAGVEWVIESIIEEDVVKGDGYKSSINFLINTSRNENGNSDPDRLPHLFSLMQPEHMSEEAELGKNLFHIYLFPFIGNTSQGNAMKGFNNHSVVGTWTNKHNGGGAPEKTLLTENQSAFERGSLSRTIAHEIGHVLTLSHNECSYGCLMGGTTSDGYVLSDDQKIQARIEAYNRSI